MGGAEGGGSDPGDGGVYRFCSSLGPAGHRTALPERVSLVCGDPEAQPSAYRVPLIGIGQHERGHGDEYGR